MVFEKSNAPKTYEEFLNWAAQQAQWNADRDYSSTLGTSPKLVRWFMDMKNTFPPLEDVGTQNNLTDYTIGSDIIYAAFRGSVTDEVCEKAYELAKKHDVGFYDPQSGEVYCDQIILCRLTTESLTDEPAIWGKIEKEILTLDCPTRGTSYRDGAFVTLLFENNGTDEEFMQCSPDYPKQKGFFTKLFGLSKGTGMEIDTYTVEAKSGDKIFTIKANKEQTMQVIRSYYTNRKLPDLSGWVDSGII